MKSKMAVGSCALLALIASEGRAQSPADQPVNEFGADIIVTAQKRSENIQRVPIAVTAVTADALNDRNFFDTTQLPQVVPSLQVSGINNQVGGINFSVRGVGTAVYSPAIESSVSTVIDGVVLGRPEMGSVQFFDLERVEVLQGPQGTLFGKNASAGVINIVTARPKLDRVEALGHLEYGKINSASAGNEIIAQAAVNVPLSESSAVRISGFGNYRDPLVKNINNKRSDYSHTEIGLRAKYLWRPDDSLSMYLQGDIARQSGVSSSAFTPRKLIPGGFEAGILSSSGIVAGPSNLEVANDGLIYNRFTVGGAQAEVTYELESGISFTNIAAYRFFNNNSGNDPDLAPLNVFNVNDQSIRDSQFSNEFRITSPTGGWIEYVAGLYYFTAEYENSIKQAGDLLGLIPITPPPGLNVISANTFTRVKPKSYAAFGQVTLRPADRLRLILGGRVTHDKVSLTGSAVQGASVLPLGARGTVEGSTKETAFSYRIGAQYDLAPSIMVYASYTRGYKGPGLNTNVGVPPQFVVVNKEIPKAYEIGVKSTFLDRRVTLNLSAWDETFEGFQAQGVAVQFGSVNYTQNAGSLKSRGAEAALTVRPTGGLTLNGSIVYTDAYYRDFVTACYSGQPTGPSGRNVCRPDRSTDASGNRLANSSTWTYSLAGNYETNLSGDLDGFVQANWYHRSSTNFTATGNPDNHLGGYGLLGGSVGIRSDDRKWELSLFGRNILDKRFPSLITNFPLDGATGDAARGGNTLQFFNVDSFRTIGVALNVHI